ncbi:uncharacterized protein PAC_02759 [Phialocephala subalpina]|uniref:Gag1-like clamp domain-containing protein n=1 Tax=Phialocephala subalpina TaxID=576137 RepID=A0A1L7WJC8_9HELO|nr:uncharacterized protein PAC_02759 [Phialocephala subalpina]
MSQTQSAVLLDAADSPITPAAGAHEHKLHDAVEDTIDDATQAMATASLHVVSPDDRPSSISREPSISLDHNNSYDAPEVGVQGPCVTRSSLAHDPSSIPAAALNEGDNHDPVAPPNSIGPPSPRDATPPLLNSHTKSTTATIQVDSQSATQIDPHNTSSLATPALQGSGDGAADAKEDRMIFGHPPASVLHRRRNYANTNAMTDYEADLTSKDRAKQKDAVKKYLADRVRRDWTYEWPRPEPRSNDSSPEREPEQLDDAILEGRWKERDEWLSNASDSDPEHVIPGTTSSPDTPSPASKNSPFRFESPDGVGITIKKTQLERKRRRKKRLAEEMAWNEGLRCFITRRDAWTGARRVSRSRLGFAGIKPIQRASMSSEDGGSSTAIEPDEDDEWEDEIEVPVAPPLIPPENAMRASILPAAYNTIYDKVVVQALTPSCPMNLKDVTRSCVQGWKRDGEWPPKSTPAEQKKKGRKMSIASLFGVEKHEKEVKELAKPTYEKEPEKKGGPAAGLRKGLQKILHLGQSTKEPVHTNIPDGKGKEAEATHVS